jgi:hypothetical protein
MKKIIVFSLLALFAGSVFANNAPQQANNSNAPKVEQDKDKDKDKDHRHRHHRHHHEHKAEDKK